MTDPIDTGTCDLCDAKATHFSRDYFERHNLDGSIVRSPNNTIFRRCEEHEHEPTPIISSEIMELVLRGGE